MHVVEAEKQSQNRRFAMLWIVSKSLQECFQRIMETHPHPLGPTIAVFFPAGIVKLTFRRIGRSG